MSSVVILSILLSLVFIGVGFYYGREVKSLKDFFFYKKPGNKKKLILSLVASNLTLGTGLVYLAQGGFSNGVLFLLVPISLWFGYFLLAKFIKCINFNSDESNFFEFINDKISNNQTKSIFKRAITGILLVTFIFVISYEIFASSTILSPLIFNSNELSYQIVIASFLIITTLIYSITSGMKGVIVSDKIQIILIIIAVGFLLFGNYNITFENASTNFQSKLILSSDIILIVILASINAIATQFYSILNHGIMTNAYAVDRNTILRQTGFWSGIAISFFIIFGLILPNDNSILDFTTLLVNSYGEIALVFITLGFLSIIYSTLDSLLVIISMFFHKNILNKKITSNNNKKDLNSVREIISLSFILIFVLLALFFYYKTDLFFLLLGIGSGISIIVPLIILTGYLYKKNRLTFLKNRHIVMYIVLFVGAHISYIYLIAHPSLQSGLPYLGYIFLLISIAYTSYLYCVSKKMKNG